MEPCILSKTLILFVDDILLLAVDTKTSQSLTIIDKKAEIDNNLSYLGIHIKLTNERYHDLWKDITPCSSTIRPRHLSYSPQQRQKT